tara:strand:- start:834 stop:1226 length:393 start_codon:yes stop_codon:yes gene_type:complete
MPKLPGPKNAVPHPLIAALQTPWMPLTDTTISMIPPGANVDTTTWVSATLNLAAVLLHRPHPQGFSSCQITRVLLQYTSATGHAPLYHVTTTPMGASHSTNHTWLEINTTHNMKTAWYRLSLGYFNDCTF